MSDRTQALAILFTVAAIIVSAVDKNGNNDKNIMTSMSLCMVCMSLMLLLSSILDSIGAQ